MNKRLVPLLVALPLSPLAQAADQLPTLTVHDTIPVNPNTATPDEYNRTQGVNADGGDFLGQFTGISTSRFGGRGLEPVIRGQSQTRLNVLLDGAYLHGGCPNRMDPPASWAALETYEEVTVLKGVQTLIYGAGGSGGTVLFERDSRALAQEKGLHGRAGLGASDNATDYDAMVDMIQAGDKGYARLLGQVKKNGNYNDGDDREVRSAFKHQQGGIILGLTPTQNRLFELSYEHSEASDVLYPGSGMDSPEESGDVYRLKFEDKPAVYWSNSFEAEIYQSDIYHVMDNFSLRKPPVYGAMHPKAGLDMLRATPTDSITTGGRIIVESGQSDINLAWGMDWQKNKREAELNNLDSGTATAISIMWPEATVQQLGLFAEATQQLTYQQKIKYGLRVDVASASANRADEKPPAGPNTANQVYNLYYGETAEDKNETNTGALLRYENDLQNGVSIFTGISRSIHIADATERYINKWGMIDNQRWVGNPAIKSEKHHQIDFGVAQSKNNLEWSLVFFYDDVTDYILRDAALGQSGILLADRADIYRNIDAELYGAETEVNLRLNRKLDLSSSLAYVHATNITDNRPIAQTPPLNGKIQVDYRVKKGGAGARLRFAADQDRIDELSKQEVGKTGGYAVLDLYSNLRFSSTLSARFGIDNTFDRTYAQHISRANLMDTEALRVNEPGRTLWMRINAKI
ncbi:MAG: TonB-dependent copper receptor [Thiotrichales bacterium]